MYADHPGVTENFDRPERTIKDLAAVIESDAVYVAEEKAAYADAKVFPQWREVIEDMMDDIGVSIRATAEVDDSSGKRVVTRLLHAESVDFVTKAGRGGKIAEVLESARHRRVTEATVNTTREWLNAAIKDAHGAEDTYVWVRDFDEANAWFEVSGPEEDHLYQQAYTVSGNTATLDGEPVEVRAEVRYVPISAPAEESKTTPADPAGETTDQEEATMATIDDKELAALRESASRATTAASERATKAETALTDANDTAAAALVTAALGEAGLTAPKTAARLSKGYLVTENGVLDVEAFQSEVAESIAELAEAGGAGSVRGLGGSTVTEGNELTEESATAKILALRGAKKEAYPWPRTCACPKPSTSPLRSPPT